MQMHRHSDATLMGMTKKELVAYVRVAEHNYDVANEALHRQAENVAKRWMPVVHGRWEKEIDPTSYSVFSACSICGSVGEDYFEYCPYCGAKMNGERKDNEEN